MMLQTTLLKIKNNSRVLRLKPSQVENLIRILSFYKIGHILYPGLFIRKLNIPMSEVYEILEEINNLGLIEKAFELHCYSCNRSTGIIYDSFADIPEELECNECGHQLKFPEGLTVVYRVIKE